jgi:hypothetical protein
MSYEKTLHASLETAWRNAIDNKQYFESLVIAAAFLQVSRFIGDKELELGASMLIGASADLVSGSEPRLACSFCGRQPPDVQLVAGDKAHICNECVKDLTAYFGGR